ncbi:MAG: pantoate--beta-alanine ligase [Candidatus Sericytochromatia bacterium]|nr:pantoate--beta-alanine ligase [Candidatus Sericytochromatia bacterium]
MEVVRDPKHARNVISDLQRRGRTVGMVPTMGFLHAGHGALIDAAEEECDEVVVTIFVNPTQFGPQEDLTRYPRDLERDLSLIESRGAQWVFVPDVSQMYPSGTEETSTIVVPSRRLTERLCGEFRPGHFSGVATIVTKLFALWQPQFAYFGLKDFQQTAVIKAMVRDLMMPVEIRTVATIREPDGLALSSRNVYLSPAERHQARAISGAMQAAWEVAQRADAVPVDVISTARRSLAASPDLVLQYLELVDEETLEPAPDLSRSTVLAVAVWLGATRLIDNVALRGTAPLAAVLQAHGESP